MNAMVATDYFNEAVSLDNIRGHIQALEGVRHPLYAPGALEHAADYITESLRSLDYDVADHILPGQRPPLSEHHRHPARISSSP